MNIRIRRIPIVALYILGASTTVVAADYTSPTLDPLYGINPPGGWQEHTFASVLPATSDVSVTITAGADLNEVNEFVAVNALGGKDFGDVFTGDSGTGCGGSHDSVNLTMTAAQWNSARSSSAGGVGGVKFEFTPSSFVTNICCPDTCSTSGPGGSSECCPGQCQPFPCFVGSVIVSVSYTHTGCSPPCSGGQLCCGNECRECCTSGDCEDGVGCTTDSCVAGSCVFTANDSNCPDDGAFCNGSEFCDPNIDCTSTGDRCPGLICCENSNTCANECCNHAACDDSNVCTSDACLSGACQYTNNSFWCDDGLFCTVTDTCSGGVCGGIGDACPGQICCEDVDTCNDTCCDDGDCGDPNLPYCNVGSDACMECQVIYVKSGARSGGGGLSWGTAYDYLQDALTAAGGSAATCVDIWVAAGVYKPAGVDGARSAAFELKSGVALYGGFGDGETSLDQRDIKENETILSGDLNDNDEPDFQNNGENSYHVTTGSGTDQTAVLDGFTITAGNANGSSSNGDGGGMYNSSGSPAVINCTVTGNSSMVHGGGMWNTNSSSPTVINCSFNGNSSVFGGGLYNWDGSHSTVTNCRFSGNSATLSAGGMYNWLNSHPTVTNCAFSGNSAGANGGGMNNGFGSSPTVTNCIFWRNTDDGGMDESAQIHTDIGTPTVTYSCIQGLDAFSGGTGNIGDDPLFVDADGLDGIPGTVDDDLRLMPESPCIDVADNEAVPLDTFDVDDDGCADDCVEPECCEPTPDLDLNPRILGAPATTLDCPVVDMGAYEYYAETCGPDEPECDDVDVCTTNTCTEGVCDHVCENRPYGDVTPFGSIVPPCPADPQGELGDGFANMADVYCAFDGFNDGFPYTSCPCCDVSPCGGDGFCNMLDVFAIFNVFTYEVYLCDDPCVCDACGEAMAMGAGASEGSRIVESGEILVGILTTIAPVSVDRYRYGVEAIADWLIERMTMDQRSALADKLENPSQEFADDRVGRMIPAIVSALRGE